MAQDQFKRKLTTILAPLFAAILIIIVGCGGGGESANSNTVGPPPVTSPPAIPAKGVYLGALLMEGLIPIEQFNSDIGVQHALFSDFFEFPEILSDAGEIAKFNSFFSASVAAGAIPMISLRHTGGSNLIPHNRSSASRTSLPPAARPRPSAPANNAWKQRTTSCRITIWSDRAREQFL